MAISVYGIARSAMRPLYVPCRSKSSRTTMGVPPEKGRSFAERIEELTHKDPNVHYKVDIGFALKKLSRKVVVKDHAKILRDIKNDQELEALSRAQKLLLPLDEVEKDYAEYLKPIHTKSVAQHYGVYQDLFGDAFFHPVVDMEIQFNDVPVYRGNVVKPSEATARPKVAFKSLPEQLWTLVMTTPDGTSDEVERIHWMVGNIKAGDLTRGEELCQYMQPLPFQGLGYLRYIFILYKQEEIVDYSELKSMLETTRFFSTKKFYSKRQNSLTPAGLAFFTSDWDVSVTNYYQNVLQDEPPVFEYDFLEPYYKPQVWFPIRQPFNLYLDRYRDPKEIAKEFLTKKLKMTDPFKGDLRPKYPYPNAVPIPRGTPSWLTNEIKKERLGRGRAADYS